MILICYTALGSLVFSLIMDLSFQDGLYYTVVSIESQLSLHGFFRDRQLLMRAANLSNRLRRHHTQEYRRHRILYLLQYDRYRQRWSRRQHHSRNRYRGL